MLLQLQKYTFQLVYIPGTQLVVADMLSRACLPDQTAEPADEEIAALTDAEQLDILKMVASPATIELSPPLPRTSSINCCDDRSTLAGTTRAVYRQPSKSL